MHARLSRLSRVALATLAAASLAASLAACGADSSTTAADVTPAALAVVRGADQTATVGTSLPIAVTVRVTTTQSEPVAGATVTFAVASGSATVTPSSAVSDADGLASTQVTLGATPGTVRVTASVAGGGLTASIVATAAAAPTTTTTTATCTGDAATLMAVGQVSVLTSGTALCLPGGAAGAEYALVPFNASTSASSRAALTVQAAGVVATASASSLADVAAMTDAGAGSLSLAASRAAMGGRVALTALHARLHDAAERELAPRLGAARSWLASRSTTSGPSRAVIPRTAAVGDLLMLNANADDACTNVRPHAGRVAAVGTKSVVVADTGNPTGGYTDAEYQSIAAKFDTLVAPLDVEAFGDPTDIDGNGKVVLFFTRAVNELTPASSGWYVGGFFWSRDLFPATGSADEACAGSNAGEMFYMMVPDPNGTINDNKFTKDGVSSVMTATLAHEFQHLINASRRMYVNTAAQGWEETWLDEGLSHVAEELAFYRVSGLGSRQNLDATALRRTTRAVNAFNEFQLENVGRFSDYLGAPTSNSPYAADDSLSTRGATWSFLRYAADQQPAEAPVWKALVNSTTTGMANLRQVFGTDVATLFRDWATSNLVDDLAGVGARWQEGSWGYRSIYSALGSAYPLATTALGDGVSRTVSLVGGGAAYLRFGVAANGTGTVQWGTLPTNVQLTLVRTR